MSQIVKTRAVLEDAHTVRLLRPAKPSAPSTS